MSKIRSRWKLTLDPGGAQQVVILDYNQLLSEELQMTMTKGLEVVPLTDTEAPFLRATGNAYYSLGFTVFGDGSDDADARVIICNYLAEWMFFPNKLPLRLQIFGRTDRHYQFGSAMVTSLTPRRELESPLARIGLQYSITAASFKKTIY